MIIETLYSDFLSGSAICTDTRKITKNCIFFALKGENFNGNCFAKEAIEKGAKRVVIDEVEHFSESSKMLLVSNALATLQQLAKHHRLQLGIPIIGLTGSNGKTTTKELINAVLSKKYKTSATKGNLNNHIGVPLTLLSMTKDTGIGIVEMGANHQKEIALLSDIAMPDYGYITNFGKAHLEGFGGLEGVIKGKTELYKHLNSTNKLVFVNGNDERQLTESKNLNRKTFGPSTSDYPIQLLEASNFVKVQYQNVTIESNLIGLYNFNNIAAAIAIGAYFDISDKEIKEAIENYIPTNNRSQIIEKNTNRIILDAYNANPTSMMAAIKNFEQTTGAHKILFLGDMFELGEVANKEHQAITTYLSENNIGTTYLIGKNFEQTQTNAKHIRLVPSFEKLKDILTNQTIEKSSILIKASRGMALERILNLL